MTILGMVTVLEMANSIWNKTNDPPRDGGHPLDRLKDFDHFGEGDLPMDGDRPKIGDHLRDGDHP